MFYDTAFSRCVMITDKCHFLTKTRLEPKYIVKEAL